MYHYFVATTQSFNNSSNNNNNNICRVLYSALASETLVDKWLTGISCCHGETVQ